MSKYSINDVKLWAEEYKKYYSFAKVGRIFGICHKIIKQHLIKNKIRFDIKTKQDLSDEGLRRCSVCEEIKLLKKFGSHWQKSRCRKCIKNLGEEYRKNNSEKCLIAERKWYNKNKTAKAEYKKRYRLLQKNNVEYKLKKRLRGRLREAIKNRKKAGSAVKDLGCTVEELKNYLEKQFYNNSITYEMMTWDNYGYYGWHVDHIKSLFLFDLENRKQFLEACHYTNLQPLWVNDHNVKTTNDLKQEKDK